MSAPRRQRPEGILDWTVLKYGWLIVFMIHGIFLVIGLGFLRRAAYLSETGVFRAKELANLYGPEQLRISNLLDSMYMFAIAFSLILVILAVFVLEIFRTTQKVLMDVEELRDLLQDGPPDLDALAGEGSLSADGAGLPSGRGPSTPG